MYQPYHCKVNPIRALDRSLGFQEVEAPRFLDNRHMVRLFYRTVWVRVLFFVLVDTLVLFFGKTIRTSGVGRRDSKRRVRPAAKKGGGGQ